MYPSTLDMVAMALPMPVYMAAGVGLTTCIRVYDAERRSQPTCPNRHPDSVSYLEQINRVHHRVFLVSVSDLASLYPLPVRGSPYGDASECASDHIRCQREVRWKGLISTDNWSAGTLSTVAGHMGNRLADALVFVLLCMG